MNTVKELRLKYGLTQRDLAIHTKLSLRHINNLELGIPKELPGSVLRVLSTLSGVPLETLQEQYQKDRELSILSIPEEIKNIEIPSDLTFEEIRRYLDMSKIKFATMFNIPPSTLSYYEAGKYRTMPASIIRALELLGFDQDEIERIHDASKL